MFIEQNRESSQKKGWIEVITGSMFSGKTEELIRRINRVRIAGKEVKVFKPHIDNRYDADKIVSHNKTSLESIKVKYAEEILSWVEHTDVISVDESQFFDDTLVDVCNDLANMGKRVIVAGLDMDYKGNPFGPLPRIMAIAEYITKLQAICMECGDLAH